MANDNTEIIAELNRRGLPIPEKYRHLDSGLSDENLPTKGVRAISEKLQNYPALNKAIGQAAEFVDPFNKMIGENPITKKYIEPFGAGALQTGTDMALSLANIPRQLAGKETLEHPDFAQYLDPEHSRVANIAGSLSAGLLGGGAALGATQRMLPNLPGMAGYLTRALGGAGTGAALAEGMPGGRIAGAALGLIPSGQAVTNRGVGERIVEGYRNTRDTFRREYGEIFRNAEREGVRRIPTSLSEREYAQLSQELPAATRRALTRWRQNPSFENSHWLQSDLNKYANKVANNLGAQSSVRNAGRIAGEFRDRMQRDIFNELAQNGGLDLLMDYSHIGRRYAQEMGPYLNTQSILNAAKRPTAKGAINPSRLPSKLQGQSGDAFRSALGHQYPELEINRMLADPIVKNILEKTAQGAALGGGAVGAGYGLYNLFGNRD